MATTMMYIMPLLLGRTIDLNKLEVGVDIYPQDQVSTVTVIQNPVTETRYKIIDSTEEARNFLDVGGAVSLNVKSGTFKAGVAGAYLSDVYNRENTVEIIVKATFQTETHTLSADARPFDSWKMMGGLGTHYVKSITYGGELIASVRLISNNTRNKLDIKGALEAGARVQVIDFGFEVEGGYMSDVSKSVDSMQIKVYSTVPLSKIPHNVTELQAMLDRFPEDMKSYNKGKGVPIKMELWPLEYLDSSKQKYIQNRVLEAYLETFEQKFDDLVNTKAAVSEWMKVIMQPLTDAQENQIGAFYDEVSTILTQFHGVIGGLDMTGKTDQLQPALQAYGEVIPGHFYNRYRKLRQSISHDQGEWNQFRGTGATYSHWGVQNCTNGSETVSSGYAKGPSDFGGGSNFMCFKDKTESVIPIKKQSYVHLASISYSNGGKFYELLCCTCRIPSKGSARTFTGVSTCPKDWNFIYSGVLYGGSTKIGDTDFVCLDSERDSSETMSSEYALIPTQMSSGTLKGKPFPCVVCSL